MSSQRYVQGYNIDSMKKVLIVGHLGVSMRGLFATCLTSDVSLKDLDQVKNIDKSYKLDGILPSPEVPVTREEIDAHPFAKYMK